MEISQMIWSFHTFISYQDSQFWWFVKCVLSPSGSTQCLKVSCQSHLSVFSPLVSCRLSVCMRLCSVLVNICLENWRKLQSSYTCLRLRPQAPPSLPNTHTHISTKFQNVSPPIFLWIAGGHVTLDTHTHFTSFHLCFSWISSTPSEFVLCFSTSLCPTVNYKHKSFECSPNRGYNVTWTIYYQRFWTQILNCLSKQSNMKQWIESSQHALQTSAVLWLIFCFKFHVHCGDVERHDPVKLS